MNEMENEDEYDLELNQHVNDSQEYYYGELVDEVDRKVNEAIAQEKDDFEKSKFLYSEYVDEGLGEDFEDAAWVPPSLEIAWEYRLAKLYKGGRTPLSKIHITKAGDIGEGVPMYFQFVKSMSFTFFLMSLLSIPALVFCYFGEGVLNEDRDGIGMYKFTIGNIGASPTYSNYETMSRCSNSLYTQRNLTCTTVFGHEFTLEQVSSLLTVTELLQIILFFIAYFDLLRRISRIKMKSEHRICSITDYSIIVENIPSDTTSGELLHHFSQLYPLDTPDWKGRPILEGASPVINTNNSKDPMYGSTWVGEVVVHSRIGDMLRQFKNKQDLMADLLRSRAKMKMFADGTSHHYGADRYRHKRAEDEMLKAGAKIDLLTAKTVKETRKYLRHVMLENNNVSFEQNPFGKGGAKSEAFIGFVVFNYAESMARCVEDYARYNNFPLNLFMPEQLKFKGKNISVKRAPEPDEILYENLEIPISMKYFRRSLTAIFTVFMLLIGFAIILQSSRYKQQFSDSVPNLEMCKTEIPAIYIGSYQNVTSNIKIVRPENSEDMANNDLACNSLDPESFYAIFTYDGSDTAPIANYSFSFCTSKHVCPHFQDSAFCPCATTTSKAECDSLSCQFDKSSSCRLTFQATTIAGCYCYDQLTSLFANGFLSGLQDIFTQDYACKNFFLTYTIALFMTFVASLCTVLINKVLKWALSTLAKNEKHNTIDEEQGAIMAKVFIATYINMAVIVLIAYGSISSTPHLARQARVLDGQYNDFTSTWYGQVGSYMVMTFALETFGPLLSDLFQYYIIYPCKRMRAHPKISSRTSYKYAMQADVNALEVGPIFDTTVHTAQLLALLFFAMTYAPGIPIMMILTFIGFSMYFYVDKLLLCKFFTKPPHMGAAVMQLVLFYMPWAAVIRLCIACWMYSNYQIFPYGWLNIESLPDDLLDSKYYSDVYNNWVLENKNRHYYFVFTGDRIMRGNVFPLFLLLVLILGVIVLFKLWKYSPLNYLYASLRFLWKTRKRVKRISPDKKTVSGFDLVKTGDILRAEMAPFTGDYFQYLEGDVMKERDCCRRIKFKPDLTDDEGKAGWRISYNGPHKVKMIQWQKNARIGDVARTKGSLKKTYEVIAEHGCWTYRLDLIPAYQTAMQAIKEGALSVEEELKKSGSIAEDATENIHPRNSVLGDYHRRKDNKEFENEVLKEKAESAWKKPTASKKIAPKATVPQHQMMYIDDDDDDEGGLYDAPT